jgi:predicted acylesterase/phospholipase RssA
LRALVAGFLLLAVVASFRPSELRADTALPELLSAAKPSTARAEFADIQDSTCADTSSFALVLGGGGARGFAEIGVLKVLEEEGLRPALIVGSSMGAVLGALYACGYSAARLQEMVREQDWFSLFNNGRLAPARLQGGWHGLPPTQLALLLDRLPPMLPRSLSGGQAITELIGRLSAEALLRADNDFDRLPIPFRAVAVDLHDGRIVVLRRGALARAAQASGTIPLLLPPVRMEGRELVDGGFRANNPVELAHILGFRRTLVVDVSNIFLPDKKSPEDLYQMWIRSMELQQYSGNFVEPAPGDVVLHLPLQNYRSLSFSGIDEMVQIGYQFADARRDLLDSLRSGGVHSPRGAAATREIRVTRGAEAPTFDGRSSTEQSRPVESVKEVRVEDLDLGDGDGMSAAELHRRLGIDEGDRLKLSDVYRRLKPLGYAPGVESAWIEVDRAETSPSTRDAAEAPATAVRLRPHLELRRGPRLRLAGHVITDDTAAILARLHQARLPLGGGEVALGARYSERTAASELRLRQGIPPGSQFSLTASFSWSRDRPWVYEQGLRIDRLAIQENRARLELGLALPHPGAQLRLGLQSSRLASYRESRVALEEVAGPRTANGFTAELESGVETGLSQSRALGYRVRYWRGVPAWGDLGFWRVEGGAVGVAHGLGRLRPSAAVGFVHGSTHLPAALRGRAGGPFGWTGLRREEIFASRLLWSRVGLGWQLAETLRLGVSAAVGWSDEESLGRASALRGAGVELAWKTPLGPCRMSWAVAERRNGAIFVQLGPEF